MFFKRKKEETQSELPFEEPSASTLNLASDGLQNVIDDLKAQLIRTEDDLTQANARAKAAEEQSSASQANLAEAAKREINLSNQYNELKELFDQTSAIAEHNTKLAQTQSELRGQLAAEVEARQDTIDGLKAEIAALNKVNEDRIEFEAKLEEDIADLKVQLASAQQEAAMAKNDHSSAIAQRDSLQAQMSKLLEKLNGIKQLVT